MGRSIKSSLGIPQFFNQATLKNQQPLADETPLLPLVVPNGSDLMSTQTSNILNNFPDLNSITAFDDLAGIFSPQKVNHI